jgi:hypothetical protein
MGFSLQCTPLSGQMFLMDRFFDGAFLTFGLEVIAFAEQDQEDRLDPLIYVFPRMTKVFSQFFFLLFLVWRFFTLNSVLRGFCSE